MNKQIIKKKKKEEKSEPRRACCTKKQRGFQGLMESYQNSIEAKGSLAEGRTILSLKEKWL